MTLRPLHGLAIAVLLLGLWIAWHIPIARRSIAALIELYAPRLPMAAVEKWPPILARAREPASIRPMMPLVPMVPMMLMMPRLRAVAAAEPPIPPVVSPPPQPEVALSASEMPASPEFPARQGFAFAERGYRLLAAGDRRAAAAAFEQALALEGGSDEAQAWRAQLRALRKRWFADTYTLIRDRGPSGPGTLPLLGGSQSGASLSCRLDPLDPTPVTLFARANVPHDRALAWDREGAMVAFGLSWRPLDKLPLAIAGERLVALGREGRNAWSLRLAGGDDVAPPPGANLWIDHGL